MRGGFKAAQEARPFLYSDKQHNPTFRGLAGAEYGVSIDDGWVSAMHVL
ncbi:MAG: hypothetical protein MUO70_07270 [Euryarchaeota archaeon]|nr:hypothetical protein [Euryarchaeota archaeon]